MGVSSEFRENVESGNLVIVRNVLTDYLIMDRSFVKFDEGLEFCMRKLPAIIEEYDRKEFESDKNKWNKNYLNKQLVALRFNFSKPRIDHIKNVISVVIPEPLIQNNTVSENTNIIKEKNLGNKSRTGRRIISETEISNNKNTNSIKISTSGSSYKNNIMRPLKINKRKEVAVKKTHRNTNTNKKVVCSIEETKEDKPYLKKKIDYAIILIIGGIVVTIVGVITVKPAVIGIGIAITGASGVIKVNKNK